MKITPFAGKRKTQAESKCCLLLPESRETFRLRQSQLQHASPAAGRLPAITPSTGPTAQRGHGAGKDKDTGNVPPPLPRTSAHPSICQLPRRPQPSSLLRGTVPRCARPPPCFPPQRPHSPACASLSPRPLPLGPRACAPTAPFPTPLVRPLQPPGPPRPHRNTRGSGERVPRQRGERGVTVLPSRLCCGCVRSEARSSASHTQGPRQRWGGTGKPTVATVPSPGTAWPVGAFCFGFKLKPAVFYFKSVCVRGLLLQLPQTASSQCPTDWPTPQNSASPLSTGAIFKICFQ